LVGTVHGFLGALFGVAAAGGVPRFIFVCIARSAPVGVRVLLSMVRIFFSQ
jgi:uncharacterized membrane protein YfcA